MQCPLCQKDMSTERTSTTFSRNKDKTYDRTTYVCRKDDVWISVEIPQRREALAQSNQDQ